MADDRYGDAKPSKNEHDVSEAADRKRLGENGLPLQAPSAAERAAANRTKLTVTQNPEPSPYKIGEKASKK